MRHKKKHFLMYLIVSLQVLCSIRESLTINFTKPTWRIKHHKRVLLLLERRFESVVCQMNDVTLRFVPRGFHWFRSGFLGIHHEVYELLLCSMVDLELFFSVPVKQ